jgi:Polyketide cyclase / dehydrase and lipid transport
MNNSACELEQSVEADVSPSFAWSWRTDVKNWHDPPAQFQLDGPFASGSMGTTLLPGQDPLHWHIREVRPGRSFIIEMPLDGAVLSFEWRFDAVSDCRTRITQYIVLSGDNAAAYASQVRAGFGSTLADGMKRIADAMASAERSAKSSGNHH